MNERKRWILSLFLLLSSVLIGFTVVPYRSWPGPKPISPPNQSSCKIVLIEVKVFPCTNFTTETTIISTTDDVLLRSMSSRNTFSQIQRTHLLNMSWSDSCLFGRFGLITWRANLPIGRETWHANFLQMSLTEVDVDLNWSNLVSR